MGSGTLKFEGKESSSDKLLILCGCCLRSVLTDRPVFAMCYLSPSEGDRSTSGKDSASDPHFILLVVVGEEELSLQGQLAVSAALMG